MFGLGWLSKKIAISRMRSRELREDIKKIAIQNQREEELLQLKGIAHYPIQPVGTPIISCESLMYRYQKQIKNLIKDNGFIDNTAHEYNSETMILDVIRRFISYAHLIPASENDHHHFIGGLLEHSLDVSRLSLQNALGSMLDDIGYVDIDAMRKPRYEYAAWLGGLIHDIGKVTTDTIIRDLESDKVWDPYQQNLYQWASAHKVKHYRVTFNPKRQHNEHEQGSSLMLNLITNPTVRKYLRETDDLYLGIANAIAGYSTTTSYLSNAIRKADSMSTYDNYAKIWVQHDERSKSLITGIIQVMRYLYISWSCNTQNGKAFVIDDKIYLTYPCALQDIIDRFKVINNGLNIPASPKLLLEIMMSKRVIRAMSGSSTFGQFYLGTFTEEDALNLNNKDICRIYQTPPITLIRVEWPNFVIDDKELPDNCKGILSFKKNQDEQYYLLSQNQGISSGTIKTSKEHNNEDNEQGTVSDSETPDTSQNVSTVNQPKAAKAVKAVKATAVKQVESQQNEIKPTTKESYSEKPAANKTSKKDTPEKTEEIIRKSSKSPSKKTKPQTETDKTNDVKKTSKPSTKKHSWTKRRNPLPIDHGLLKAIKASNEDSSPLFFCNNAEVWLNFELMMKINNWNRGECKRELSAAGYISFDAMALNQQMTQFGKNEVIGVPIIGDLQSYVLQHIEHLGNAALTITTQSPPTKSSHLKINDKETKTDDQNSYQIYTCTEFHNEIATKFDLNFVQVGRVIRKLGYKNFNENDVLYYRLSNTDIEKIYTMLGQKDYV